MYVYWYTMTGLLLGKKVCERETEKLRGMPEQQCERHDMINGQRYMRGY